MGLGIGCVEEDEEIGALKDEERGDWLRFKEKGMGRVRRVARWLKPWNTVKDVGNIPDGQDHLHTLQGPVFKKY